MAILYDAARFSWHIQGKNFSYILALGEDAYPHHLYWGKRLPFVPAAMRDRVNYRRESRLNGVLPSDPHYSREFYHYECPTYGSSDFRVPMLGIEDLATGADTLDLRYDSFSITPGTVPLAGLPHSYATSGAQTLTISLKDALFGVRVDLFYTLFEDTDTLTRRARITADRPVMIRQALSMSVDFEQGEFDLLTVDGHQLREFTPTLRRLEYGTTQVDSSRGTSSHNHKPMAMLLRSDATEDHGDVYAVSLLYSGNFVLRCEMDAFRSTRLQLGINPFEFSWKLEEGESFETPECVLAYSDSGMNGVSRLLHAFVREHILRKRLTPPVLLNTWEGCYFDVSQEKLERIADKAAPTGVELLVLDDGWFGRRNNDSSSLGDWFYNPEKFPAGIGSLADSLAQKGMRLGIWMEPEMISPDSDLYRAHPDWCMHTDGRVRSLWRNQLVLDLTRDDVTDYVISRIDAVLEESKAFYIKWDSNRRLTEVHTSSLPADRQGEARHRYVLNLYRILSHITETHPDVLMENCASGGGRFDYGMYCYFTQGWLSDNTDPVCRLTLQNCGSMFFPPEVMTSHVSASPNHQTERVTDMTFRKDVSLPFNFGLELDPIKLTDSELATMTEAIREYRQDRDWLCRATFLRLSTTPQPDTWFGWESISEDGTQVLAMYYRPFTQPDPAFWRVRLKGLEENALYRDHDTGEERSGADLMRYGIAIPYQNGDARSWRYRFTRLP